MEYGLSLGSNLGDRLACLREARGRILAACRATWHAASRVYETEPVGVSPEHAHLAFLNAVLVIESPLAPAALSAAVHTIEDAAGRVRAGDRYAPRPLDVDVLYAGGLALATEALRLPHPRWSERRFVVQPLADVRPDLRLPGESRAVRDVLAALPAKPGVVLFAAEW